MMEEQESTRHNIELYVSHLKLAPPRLPQPLGYLHFINSYGNLAFDCGTHHRRDTVGSNIPQVLLRTVTQMTHIR